MRVYILTDHVTVNGETHTVVLGPVSSKQHAIKSSDTYLKELEVEGDINWVRQEKHFGYVTKGNHEVTYKMFFVNQLRYNE